MSAGVFQTSQPRYAAHRIATFPIGMNKRPAVRGYPRIGLRASAELASKFVDATALGFMCGRRSRVTVLDIDTSDERLLADALSRHGPTSIIVRTASGKWHAWYRHNDERRRIRPWGDDLPIDLLGGGFVIAPPSATQRGCYEFIQGHLDDVASLPRMRGLGASLYNNPITVVPDDVLVKDAVEEEPSPMPPAVSEGRRNERLFAHCMRQAHGCDERNALLDVARNFNNEYCLPPLPDEEVVKIVHSTWRYTGLGENRFGMTGSWLPTETVRSLAPHPYLFTLVNFLQAENRPNRIFWVADGLAKHLRWPRRQFVAARREAVRRGFIEMISKPRKGHPALYRFGPAIRQGRERVRRC